MAKRYYWLKLPDGFFRQKAIKKLRKIAGGDTYTIIYLKMLLVAMKQDGRLYFEGVEATFYDELALDLDEEVENVRVTVMFLIQQDLMQLIDETEYSLSECAKMTGSESASAERMRRLRDKKASQCDIEVTEPLRIDPREEGFLWRYFTAYREVKPDGKTNDGLFEIVRTFYKFAPNGTPCTSSYEYREYKQTGIVRWCTDEGYRESSYCTLYPGNLPEAWKDTPMKYSALEILAENRPSEQIHYAKAINRYREFPQLEWFIKMGLYKLAAHLINEYHDGAFGYESRNGVRGLRKNGKTIFGILGLTKENTRVLQSIDGNIDELRLLQEAQSSGYNLKAEELERFYKLFGCNTTLIRKENRHSTIHKICRYIEREGSNYRVGERGGCWRYSYMQRKERPDIREERLQNCAKDWLDYLAWCKELKYDLTNMFFYFPKNFKKVHDRTAAEYQAVQDKKAAEKKRWEEERIKREAEAMKKLLEEMLEENAGIDNAFLIKGKGLILRVPRDAQEIKNEGAALHHCVGTYVDRVAKGQTHIFFVRRVEEPDTPYFTMEYNNGRVIQCRGSHNCGMPASVKAFVAAFEKLMKEREEKMERKCG